MSEERPNYVTFYFDTTHGNLIPRLLKRVGLDVRSYRNIGLRDDADDKEWIGYCATRDWVIISGDKDISRIPEERQAVIDGKCKVFMFEDSSVTRTEDWAASLLVARKRIIEISLRTNGPYFWPVRPCRVYGHLGNNPEFIAGGGWKPESEWPTTISPPLEHPQPPRPKRHRQATIDFPDCTALMRSYRLAAHCELCARLLSGKS